MKFALMFLEPAQAGFVFIAANSIRQAYCSQPIGVLKHKNTNSANVQAGLFSSQNVAQSGDEEGDLRDKE